MLTWEFQRGGKVNPTGPLILRIGGATDLAVDAALAGVRIVQLFRGVATPYFASSVPEPVLERRWQSFSGLFSTSRPPPLPPPPRVFIDFVNALRRWAEAKGEGVTSEIRLRSCVFSD